MTQDSTTAAPVCYRHPDRHTLLRCSRCDRPICGACSIDASVGQRCPECVKSEGTQRVIPTRTRSGAFARAGIPATRTFVGLAVAFYFFTRVGPTGNDIFDAFAQSNPAVAAGEWWRIFTPVLLHVNLTHILFNMWALWVLGPQIERGVGTWPFVGLYVAAAGVGGVFAFYIGAGGVGASGAIFGLFGIWANWAVHRRRTIQGRALLRQIGFLLLINAAIPLFIPNISWQAHLGGLIAGFAIGEAWSRVSGANATAVRTALAFAVAALAAVAVIL